MRTTAIAFILFMSSIAAAKGTMPEDLLKGRIIISDKPLPTRWQSVSSYVSQLRQLDKSTVWFDKKTGKVTLQYAAFFASALTDPQVDLIVHDVTAGAHQQKFSTENFTRQGERVLFNAIELDKQDIEPNRKYLLTIESRKHIIASGTVILRAEGPHYSGKVNFSDDDTHAADKP